MMEATTMMHIRRNDVGHRNRSAELAPAPAPPDIYASLQLLGGEGQQLGVRRDWGRREYCESAFNECGVSFGYFSLGVLPEAATR